LTDLKFPQESIDAPSKYGAHYYRHEYTFPDQVARLSDSINHFDDGELRRQRRYRPGLIEDTELKDL
jgi:hypothetical protein